MEAVGWADRRGSEGRRGISEASKCTSTLSQQNREESMCSHRKASSTAYD